MLIRFCNPDVRAIYFGQWMLFSGRHDLPLLANDLPLFNTPLRRLAQSVRDRDRQLRILDIGANVGDGIPLVDPHPGDRYWLVEGSSEFLPFLRQNIVGRANVSVLECYLGESHRVSRGTEVVTAGNAHIVSGSVGEIVFETLDRLFPDAAAASPNILKIDVEGYEERVFAGGSAMIRRDKPLIFMEWHPELLLREGSGVFAPLGQLLAAGYTEAMIYDNHGFLVGTFSLGERDRLEQLALYARMRDDFYFDLVVFAPSHAGLRVSFLASEAAFYAAWVNGNVK